MFLSDKILDTHEKMEDVLRGPNIYGDDRPVIAAVSAIMFWLGVRLGSLDPDFGPRYRECAELVTAAATKVREALIELEGEQDAKGKNERIRRMKEREG